MVSESDRQLFAGSSVFKGLPAQAMHPILEATTIRVFNADQTILSSGEVGDGIYVLLDGQVKVFLPQEVIGSLPASKTEMKISLATLERGACFGEYSLVDQKEVSATVQAVTPVRLGHLATTDFHQIVSDHLLTGNIIYKNLLRVLVSRCREANMELDGSLLIYY